MPANETVARRGQTGRPRAAAGEVATVVRRGTRAVKAQAAEKVAEVSRKLRDEGEKLLDQQKLRAAGGLRHIGLSIQDVAGRLGDGPLEPAGPYVEAAAERVSRASEYLAERDVAGVLEDAEAVVLRRPQMFLSGMFVTGLILARFIKATGSAARSGAPSDAAPKRRTVRRQQGQRAGR